MTPRTLVALALTLVGGASAIAQPIDYREYAQRCYAQGVQEFFNGSTSKADALFTQALAYSPRDPRGYYFRGLARMRLGRSYEGEQDLRIGAAIEASWSGNPLDIGRTLQRVQGGDRLKLEQIRREARDGRARMQVSNEQQRYQPTTDRSKEAVRAEFRFPLEALSTADSPDELAELVSAQAESSGDPFADDPVEKVPTPVDLPEGARGSMTVRELGSLLGRMMGLESPGNEPLPGPSDQPELGDTPFAGEPPSEDAAPFAGEAASAPAADPFAAEPAAEEEDPAAADPFADPFGDSPPAEGDAEDPFGEL
ncbi:MAG: hypothetical protein KDA37_14305 [Planctomycetales bacterium]|nr:hypothetical protein [Planctomycetales bacterium]